MLLVTMSEKSKQQLKVSKNTQMTFSLIYKFLSYISYNKHSQ